MESSFSSAQNSRKDCDLDNNSSLMLCTLISHWIERPPSTRYCTFLPAPMLTVVDWYKQVSDWPGLEIVFSNYLSVTFFFYLFLSLFQNISFSRNRGNILSSMPHGNIIFVLHANVAHVIFLCFRVVFILSSFLRGKFLPWIPCFSASNIESRVNRDGMWGRNI